MFGFNPLGSESISNSGAPVYPYASPLVRQSSTTLARVLRRQTDSGDMIFGHGLGDFWPSGVDAVRQRIETRLKLMTGEWFLNLQEGTPYSTQVLGVRTKPYYDAAIRQRILDTQGVESIISYSSVSRDRKLFVSATVQTIFGSVAVVTPLNVVQA